MLQQLDERLEKLHTPAEVQAALRISRPTFYRRVEDGSLPVIRVGGALRVRAIDLQQMLESGLPLRAGQGF
jgi:excisionase family DNA binding protein